MIGGLQKVTLLDYPGKVACTVFLTGCNLRCPYCHNPELVLPQNNGKPVSENELFEFFSSRRGKLDGVCITGGELTLAGDASIDCGEVRISGGTVTFGHGLWLGEGDIVITGGTVIVPGGEAGLTAENGKVTISGGAVREP